MDSASNLWSYNILPRRRYKGSPSALSQDPYIRVQRLGTVHASIRTLDKHILLVLIGMAIPMFLSQGYNSRKDIPILDFLDLYIQVALTNMDSPILQ